MEKKTENALRLSRRAGACFAKAEEAMRNARRYRYREDRSTAASFVRLARDFNRNGVLFMRLAREAVSA